MELEVRYNPDVSKIDVLEDVTALLKQLSECYNSKIDELEQEVVRLKEERGRIAASVQKKNWEGLEKYFGCK